MRTLAILGAILSTGCAQVVVMPDGTRRVTGLVQVDLPAVEPAAGESVHVRAFGLLLARSGAESSISLGYSDTTHTMVRQDSCVAIGMK
jgi:hydrogenase/urease accessory protein HupE